MNAQLSTTTYRKFNNLLNSGAVTVTGPGQPRILKTTRLVMPNAQGGGSNVAGALTQQLGSDSELGASAGGTRCYICDELVASSQVQNQLTEMTTTHTTTKFPNKLAQLVGEGFVVIVSTEDFVCSRCTNLVNYFDRLENDVERVKANLLNLLNKKYGINEDSGGGESSPPLKMQKLVSGANRSMEESTGADLLRTRKVVQQPSPGSVQQLKISTSPQSAAAGTQTVQRKATKIYKCTSCDYKTSDMRLFNTHYETCKQQTFQCKTCRKIFPHFGAMKQHMVRDHNTAMDNTCAMCHINFVNELSLRKHMEANHATNVLVTSTTTIPANAAAPAVVDTSGLAAGSALYTCNHCQFKSTDKGVFDDHMRKHVSGKPKPFKCRLCSQRFETREAATVHAKQHQTNYFKCGTCAMTFPKRELLVKHFEVHQTGSGSGAVSPGGGQSKLQTASSTQNFNTQKLLQETIDEALSDTVPQTGAAAAAVVAATAEAAENNIRFFSCSICSLTFIQETYYNHHMETHRRDKKGGAAVAPTVLNSAATALLSDDAGDAGGKAGDDGGEQSAEADIESLFEKLHSEKTDNGDTTKTTNSKSGEMVITSQQGSGGITFNITIPQPDASGEQAEKGAEGVSAPVSVSIDMPVLDQADDESQSQASTEGKTGEAADSAADTKSTAAPVSMPSLDDDNEATASTETDSKTANSKSGEKSDDKADQQGEQEATTATETAGTVAEEGDDGEKRDVTDTPTTEPDAAASAEASESADGEANAVAAEGEGGEAAAGDQQVAMELDEAMQAQVEGGQIKFIMNENGHLLQLDNHILTDSEGNQIIVQDPEQIQQLLQSVGVLQSGEGLEGETLQMMTDASGQMVLVHGDNNEQQLIDASLINADGQLIIQQGQDGEEGPHVISEDGTRIPVSVSYTEDGQPIVQVQQQVLEAATAAAGSAEEKDEAADVAAAAGEEAQATEDGVTVATSTASSSGTAASNFFALEEFTEAKTD
ncbi:uncharacterized protein LOC115622690 [Scaptodrosophila lebanonensis]|uniref:Uncharacterized protein LOC115622690 n=1 Tax=Drosophila lebanonensis TaxID=7225 RepID=A0A6J2TB35_DROLE|nr:uncharacterized protein LOC115622690 [Scaptodrosophila lebanonensis]